MNKVLVGENIVKSFGEGAEKRNVLDGVSVEINQGEFVSVMGPRITSYNVCYTKLLRIRL